MSQISENKVSDINKRIGDVRLLGAVEDVKTIGLATLITFHALTGKRARLEDVAVSKEHRRSGVGSLMCEKLISEANGQDVVAIDLTSSPSSKAVNELYKSMGFVRGEINVFGLTL